MTHSDDVPVDRVTGRATIGGRARRDTPRPTIGGRAKRVDTPNGIDTSSKARTSASPGTSKPSRSDNTHVVIDHRQRIIAALADVAISTGAVVVHVGTDVMVIPDTLQIQAFANGLDEYQPPTITRDDARSVWIYQLSDAMSLLDDEVTP